MTGRSRQGALIGAGRENERGVSAGDLVTRQLVGGRSGAQSGSVRAAVI